MSITALIVDDSKLARIVAGKTLTALQPDWKRVEASDAEQALGIVRSQKIDVALLDYNMPGMNGLALAEVVRTEFPQMPIAVITANIQDEVVAQAHEIGATFVNKPITEDGLRGFVSGAALRLRGAEK